jgi:hypothetical protein
MKNFRAASQVGTRQSRAAELADGQADEAARPLAAAALRLRGRPGRPRRESAPDVQTSAPSAPVRDAKSRATLPSRRDVVPAIVPGPGPSGGMANRSDGLKNRPFQNQNHAAPRLLDVEGAAEYLSLFPLGASEISSQRSS